ncbi:MAG: hypothetical protein ACOCRK_03680 [bacterium]
MGNSKLIKALTNFKNAFNDLEDEWAKLEMEGNDEILNNSLYPFEQSFDDLSEGVNNWVAAAEKETKKNIATDIDSCDITILDICYKLLGRELKDQNRENFVEFEWNKSGLEKYTGTKKIMINVKGDKIIVHYHKDTNTVHLLYVGNHKSIYTKLSIKYLELIKNKIDLKEDINNYNWYLYNARFDDIEFLSIKKEDLTKVLYKYKEK